MPKPTYQVDYVRLDDPAGRWRLDGDTGRRGLPAVRSTAATIPGRHGETYTPGDVFEPGTLALSLTVTDATAQGKPGGPAQTEQNLELLTAHLYASSAASLQLITHHIGAQTRANYGRVDSAVQPTALNGRLTRYRFPIILRFPNPFWFDPTGPNSTAIAQHSTSDFFNVTHLYGGSAPVTDAVIRIHTNGTAGRYTITDTIGRTGLIWEGAPTADAPYLYLHAETLTARLSNSANSWVSGGHNATEGLDYRPEGPLVIHPAPFGDSYMLEYTRPTAFSNPEALVVRANRRFL